MFFSENFFFDLGPGISEDVGGEVPSVDSGDAGSVFDFGPGFGCWQRLGLLYLHDRLFRNLWVVRYHDPDPQTSSICRWRRPLEHMTQSEHQLAKTDLRQRRQLKVPQQRQQRLERMSWVLSDESIHKHYPPTLGLPPLFLY